MPDFKIIEAETTGDVHIRRNSQYNSINANTVIVAENVQARLYGTINKLLVVKRGAHVVVHGQIKGVIENYGELYVY